MHLTTSHIARRAAPGLFATAPYAIFAWRSAAKCGARPYMIASGVYLRMLSILLPMRPRYFRPFCFVVGWSWRCSGGRLCAVALVALFCRCRVALVLARQRPCQAPTAAHRFDWVRQTVRTPSSFPIYFCGMPTFIGAKAKRDRSQSLKPPGSNSGTSSEQAPCTLRN
jgi:hypothetical protein